VSAHADDDPLDVDAMRVLKGKGKQRDQAALEHRLLHPVFPSLEAKQGSAPLAPSVDIANTALVLGGKDKNKDAAAAAAAERRVLPARIRRVAGSGQEGLRELEGMIVKWLYRYGESDATEAMGRADG
jgi:hypothetical protein